MKIAYNGSYGGFCLSYKAQDSIGVYVIKFAQYFDDFFDEVHINLDSITLHMTNEIGDIGFYRYMDYETLYINRDGKLYIFNIDKVKRHHHILIEVIEEMGEGANGKNSKIQLQPCKENQLYRIKDYDGKEEVEFLGDFEYCIANNTIKGNYEVRGF